MLPHAYEKINILLFILKLECFRNSRYALLLNEVSFFIKRLTEIEGVVGVAWSCHVRFFSGPRVLE